MSNIPVLEDSLLMPAEVGRLFRVSPKTVSRWAREGKIRAVKTPGGHRRYPETEVRRLLATKGGNSS
jgi:excisionase family DNA binding protein